MRACRSAGAAWATCSAAARVHPPRKIAGRVTMVHWATYHDTVVGRAFLDVMNLVRPPASLMAPEIVLRVLRSARASPPPRTGHRARAG